MRFVHVLSAMVWVGGQLLLSLLVLPVLRRRLDAASRAPLTREVGVRFGVFTVAVFLPLQIATGIALATHRGVTVADLAEPGYGRTLGEKVTLFAVVLVVSGVHGVAGIAWQAERSKIERSLAHFEQRYDAKYEELLGLLETALRDVGHCV